MLLVSTPSLAKTASASNLAASRPELHSRPAHELEPEIQEAFEDNNYYKSLDPEDFAVDRGWWYRCRHCDLHTRVRTKHPFCRHCGFSQQT